MPRRLGGVQAEGHPVGGAESAHGGGSLHRARHVGGMGQHHQFRMGAEQCFQGGQVEKALAIAGDAVESHPLFCQPLQRPHDGVVLHPRHDAVVAGVQRPAQHQVQPPGVAGGKHHVGGVGKIQQFAQPLAQPQFHQFRLLGGTVDAPVDVGPHLGEIFRHPRRHTGRFGEGRGGLIEVDRGHGKAPFS